MQGSSWSMAQMACAASIVAALGFGCSARAGSLATGDQIALDARFARIFDRADYQAHVAAGEGQLAGSQIADRDSAKDRIRGANQAMAVAALQLVLADDPQRPAFYWTPDAARHWKGLHIPAAGWVLNNPDNIYRVAAIDGASYYVVRGKLGRPAPTHPSFFLFNCIPGDGSPSIDAPLGGIRSEDLQVEADGTFSITIDPGPAEGRANHIQSRPNARLLIVRESLGDWHEDFADLTIRRSKGPPALPPRSDDQVAGQALQFARSANSMWIDADGPRILKLPTNTVEPLRGRGGNWGYLAAGNFKLAQDEALVVEVDPLGAAYTGFQLGDVWGVPLNYVSRTGSLTNKQARPNSDGSYTYVVAARDPGVYNWLDTEGLIEGTFLLRWQMLAKPVDPSHAIRRIAIVKLSTLPGSIPTELRVDQHGRSDQLAQRLQSWNRRLR